MILTNPVIITSRLMAGVKVGDSTISIEYSKRSGNETRIRFHYFIDSPTFEYDNDDLQSGNGGSSLQEGLESLLSFLGAGAESYRYSIGGRESDNSDLFPPNVMEWAYQNSDEITMLACELEETKGLIRE